MTFRREYRFSQRQASRVTMRSSKERDWSCGELTRAEGPQAADLLVKAEGPQAADLLVKAEGPQAADLLVKAEGPQAALRTHQNKGAAWRPFCNYGVCGDLSAGAP